MMEASESLHAGERYETISLGDPSSTHLVARPPAHQRPSPMVLGLEENNSTTLQDTPRSRPLAFFKSIVSECLCEFMAPGAERGMPPPPVVEQFVQLHGIEFIGLGALSDELSAKERVYDTLEQLTSRTERLISIGYLSDDENGKKKTQTIPLDIWSRSYPDDRAMSRPIRRSIASIKAGNFQEAIREFQKEQEQQKRKVLKQNNFFKLGITLHNLGVLSVLSGRDYESLELFQDAISIKRQSFGKDHPEVAVSLDELGIQFFSRELYGQALEAFSSSLGIIEKHFGLSHPRVCMLKNNIACCHFCMDQSNLAREEMKQALEIQQKKNLTQQSIKNDLDLLHMAIVHNNYGYLKVNAKEYEEGRSHFEEALLVQQSVFGDTFSNRAIRDSRSNLDFTNAFHS